MGITLKANLMKKLSQVALGKEPADLILKNADILNVYTGEVLHGFQVLIAGDRIAYVGPDHDFPVGPGTNVVDVEGKTVIPGMIDGHIHMDAWMSVGEFVRLSLPTGTTTIITECTSPSNSMGQQGVLEFINQLKDQPQRFFVTAPTISFLCSNYGENLKAIDADGMLQLLRKPEVLGLGEIYWPNLLNGTSQEALINLIEKTLEMGKVIGGHGAGAKNKKLAAMVAYGVNSCHEPITAEEVQERLRFGLFTMIREGSVRQELSTVIAPLVKMKLDLRRAILVSDGTWPGVLMSQGHMNHIVQKAIDLGLDPVSAIRMVTLNAAEHFHLDDDLGGIAPGKCADLVIIPDLRTIVPQQVICKGKLVAVAGKLLAEPAALSYSLNTYECVRLPRIEPGYFKIKCEAIDNGEVKVRVIDLITSIVNRETVLTLPVKNGVVSTSAIEDVIKAAVIDRYSGSGRGTIGLLKGYGLSRGALASSFSFDEGNLVVIGCNDDDMAFAVNRIKELNGGMVYCCDGKVIEEIPMPIFGSMSEMSGKEIANSIKALEKSIRSAGCQGENPLLTLFTITFTAIPSIRLLSRGYWLAKENRFAGIFA
ncbi:adenine deaminase [Desulfotruncus alcoholivorax]|uniref:adenine deaminase n=1 Tax=Desulfotruncus alcoholivorax TaxID=265477 RepID=UPI00146FC654|nr:adenine deaminase C-terminal domain-containing protein [Desulfotruncus alcoholivorax]